jgi:hypothetical protein
MHKSTTGMALAPPDVKLLSYCKQSDLGRMKVVDTFTQVLLLSSTNSSIIRLIIQAAKDRYRKMKVHLLEAIRSNELLKEELKRYQRLLLRLNQVTKSSLASG